MESSRGLALCGGARVTEESLGEAAGKSETQQGTDPSMLEMPILWDHHQELQQPDRI